MDITGRGPTAGTLDGFLREHYEVLTQVRDNIDAIRRVALRYTAVEDLEDFKIQVDALHAVLGTLMDASVLILTATDAGIDLLTAVDVPAQRAFLGLGSAALMDAGDVADATAFATAQADLAELTTTVQGLLAQLGSKATTTALVALAQRVTDLEQDTSTLDLITQLIQDLQGGVYQGNLADRVLALEQSMAVVLGQAHGLGEYIGQVEELLLQVQVLVGNHSNSQATIIGRLNLIESEAEALASLQLELSSRLVTAEGTLAGQSEALLELSSRTTAVEGGLVSEATARTALASQLTAQGGQLTAAAEAVQTLQTQVTQQGGMIQATSNEVTDLSARVDDTESGISGLATAHEELVTRVESNEGTFEALSEDVTALSASLTSVGNLWPNSGFEADVRGWVIFSRGGGWLDNQLIHDLAPGSLPPGVHTIGIEDLGLPTGDIGVRSAGLAPVTARKRYIVSAFLAARNCTTKLYWRLMDADGFEMDMGLVGQTTNGPGTNLDQCTRVHLAIDVPLGASQLQLQWWVVDGTGAPVQAWMFRPMLEEAVPGQTLPSPWVPSATGLEEALATAVETMSARVTQTEDLVQSQSAHLVTLTNQVSVMPAVFVQPAMPVGGVYRVGDIWFDTDAGYRIRRKVGDSWVNAQGDPMGNALLNLQQGNFAADSRLTDAVTKVQADALALTQLAQLARDNVLTPADKTALLEIWERLRNEDTALVGLATTLGITSQLFAYEAARDGLEDFLATMTTPYAWNDHAGPTDLPTL